MQITSLAFFAFVALTLLLYFFCVPKKYQWCVLLAASYAFYALVDWKLLGYIAFTTCTVFLGALWLRKAQEKDRPKRARQWIVALVVVGNIGILAFFKWFNALAGIGNAAIGMLTAFSFRIPTHSLLMPLGISYYSFQAVGYLIDVYRGTLKPERNIARFALFVSFFPQLAQGPISRHSELAEQLYASRKLDYTQFRHGFQLALWGLFKKLVIADRLVLVTSEIFGDLNKFGGLYIVIGLIVSMLQLYADFSGGIDTASGVAQMFGIHLPMNFKRPFFSTSFAEYWRRWHITLNNWWRDYLYYPLVLSKPMKRLSRFTRKHISPGAGRVVSVYLCINIVRMINALWHGAQLFYIARGLYDGILLTLGLILAPWFAKAVKALRINTESFSWKLFRIARTFLVVCFARVFICAGSIKAGLYALLSIVKNFNPWILNYESLTSMGLTERDTRIVVFALLAVLIVGILQEKGVEIRKSLDRQNLVFQWLVLLAGLFAVILWGMYGYGYDAAAFVYQGF